MNLEWSRLNIELNQALGDSVHFDVAHQAVYASEASNYRQIPIGVVIPKNTEEFIKGIEICHRNNAPVLMRGAGTSMNGQTVNNAVIFDISKYCNHILALDPEAGSAVVEPGVICDSLRDAAENYGLTFAPDPSTHSRCTLGGMVANNSCGAHSVMAGKTLENTEALEILTYDGTRFWVGPTSDEELERIIAAGGRKGQIYQDLRSLRDRYANLIRTRFPNIKRRVSGYNLDQLLPENGFNVARALVGTEGTCALTLAAKVRLVKSPAKRVVLVFGFEDIYLAADAVPEYQSFNPIAIEGLDYKIIRGLEVRKLAKAEIDLLPAGNAWVMLEFGDDTIEAAIAQAEKAEQYFKVRTKGPRPSTWLVADTQLQKRIWSIRENGASATHLSIDHNSPDPVVGWEDAAVDPRRLGNYLRAFQGLVDSYGYETSLYGHFGDGCVHARITFNLRTAEGVAKFRSFIRDAAVMVVEFGGSLTGEHGDGQARAEFLPIMFGEELMGAMEEFKRIWDPQNKLNPGKVVRPYRVDENLRMGPEYKVVNIKSRLNFLSQEGDGFQRAVERCVGMGKCRSEKVGTMCPSFRATKEERFSTRGRSRLFWEMIQGEVITDGWDSKELKEALDTCLACKGCKGDCPAHVDMASYKAEFLSHYHEKNSRSRQALAMGRIGDWAPLASHFSRLINLVMQTPVLSNVAKWIGGVAQERSLPKFANETFRKQFKKVKVNAAGRKKVILWVDTFCEHFHPEVANAAVEVLAHAGFEATLPKTPLCCGRPLYDFGYLDLAKQKLEKILKVVGEQMTAGDSAPIKVVGLEPGCMSVFKDELLKFFPSDPRAKLLAENTYLLGDFLHECNYVPSPLKGKVLVHSHCHQKSLFSTKGDAALLSALGVEANYIDSGCCGMAGSFGFNPEHIEISKAAGELVLLPAIRAADQETVILSNGFSCREQIEQETGRKGVHLAELLLLAIQTNNPIH